MARRLTRNTRPKDLVAIILAVGLVTAFDIIVIAVMIAAARRAFTGGDSALSENATQIITTVFGGMIGVLGSYIGYRAGSTKGDDLDSSDPPQL